MAALHPLCHCTVWTMTSIFALHSSVQLYMLFMPPHTAPWPAASVTLQVHTQTESERTHVSRSGFTLYAVFNAYRALCV